MSSGTTKSTVQSDAELRVITVKTEAGDIVKYSGNPAELPGARFETKKALLRSGAFSLLIKHNASRLRNGVIAVEDVDNIMFVTELVNDPDQASYSFEKPCPGTASRKRGGSLRGRRQHCRCARQTAQAGCPKSSRGGH